MTMLNKRYFLLSALCLAIGGNAQDATHNHDAHQHMHAVDATATEAETAQTAEPTTTASETTATTDAGDACQVALTGDDHMKYNLKSFIVPKSCDEFTIHFENVGRLPKASMGHDVVIAKKDEAQALAMDGMSAGVENDYIPPDDARVLVKTAMIGGGEKTEVIFNTDVLKSGEDYVFFCSFPGHYFTMKGAVVVE